MSGLLFFGIILVALVAALGGYEYRTSHRRAGPVLLVTLAVVALGAILLSLQIGLQGLLGAPPASPPSALSLQEAVSLFAGAISVLAIVLAASWWSGWILAGPFAPDRRVGRTVRRPHAGSREARRPPRPTDPQRETRRVTASSAVSTTSAGSPTARPVESGAAPRTAWSSERGGD